MTDDDRSVLDRAGREADDIHPYGPDPDQRIELLHPPTLDATEAPVVALLHGGYWRPQWDRSHMGPMATALADAGCLVANIEYRRVPGAADAMTADVTAAVQALADIAGRPVVLVGFSAGGHLALWCAAQPVLASVIAHVVALAPVADLVDAQQRVLDEGAVGDFLGCPAAERPDLDPVQCTPLVPVRVLHDPRDGLVPIALAETYAARHAVPLDRTTGGHFALIDPQHESWTVVASAIHGHPRAGTMPS